MTLRRIGFVATVFAGMMGLSAASWGKIPVAENFGTSRSGESVSIFKLTNAHHMTVTVINRGPTIVDIIVPDKQGNLADVNLGLDDLTGYEGPKNQMFGATVGRVASRIRG